jgi:hypothetical protein
VSEGRDVSLTREQIIGFLAELGQEPDARGVKRLLAKAQFIVQEMFSEDPAEPSPP